MPRGHVWSSGFGGGGRLEPCVQKAAQPDQATQFATQPHRKKSFLLFPWPPSFPSLSLTFLSLLVCYIQYLFSLSKLFILFFANKKTKETDFGLGEEASQRHRLSQPRPKKARETYTRARIAHISPPGVTSNKLAAISPPSLSYLFVLLNI